MEESTNAEPMMPDEVLAERMQRLQPRIISLVKRCKETLLEYFDGNSSVPIGVEDEEHLVIEEVCRRFQSGEGSNTWDITRRETCLYFSRP